MIGWAFDGKGTMAPFDGPALAAAKVRVKQVNAPAGQGVQLKIITCDTQSNNPAKAKACALNLLGQGANVIFTTCDVDFATPVVQEAHQPRHAHGRAVHRHRPDGPEALRLQGQARVQLRQRRAGRGLGDGGVGVGKGWRTAALATNTLLVYFKNVVQAFEARFKQLGGKIVGHESYATGANNVNTAVSRLNGRRPT